MLRVKDLTVQFNTADGPVEAVKRLSFNLAAGETLALVGESGSGKTQAMLALMGLLADNAEVGGSAQLDGVELIGANEAELRQRRGKDMALIFQDPMTSLNPYLTIGRQMAEVLECHQGVNRKQAWQQSEAMLERVQMPQPQRRLQQYPHELSGGQRQRVVIAMALLCRPRLLIADEPTTALDVTVQAEMLSLLRSLQSQLQCGIVFITHDLAVAAQLCDRVLVLRQGELQESGPIGAVLSAPQSAYTQALLACIPDARNKTERLATVEGLAPADKGARQFDAGVTLGQRLLAASDLTVSYPLKRGREFTAVDGLNFELGQGETLGLVGESGSGKSSVARAILGLNALAAGEIVWQGRSIADFDTGQWRAYRQSVQVVFQDPLASLSPRQTIGDTVAEPLTVFAPQLSRRQRWQKAAQWLERVGVGAAALNRYPHEFSGGQCQRIGIARALIGEPTLLICDEAVSALDVSVQAQVLNLLKDLQAEFGLTMLFISHDLAVVHHMCNRVLVMQAGRLVEQGETDVVYNSPQEPYTQALIAAVPQLSF